MPLPPVRVVTDDHLRAVLATCTGGDFASLCDAAILRVLIACGLASALALFSRSPFDFERWAVSFVNGQPNQKQVGDKGIDGVARFATNGRGGIGRALISVKGGRQLNPSMVRDLGGTVTTQQAEMGILITNGPPTRGMIDEANHAGTYQHPHYAESFPRIQIVTVDDLLSGKRPKTPPTMLPYIQALRAKTPADQASLFDSN